MKRRDDIIITTADKGGAIVIQDVKLYVKEAERQLNDTENYRPLPNDPTKINNDTANKTIKRFQKKKHLIKDRVPEGLITQNPRTSHFYTKPKIHREGIPGRPVISWVNCHSSKISEYVHYYLQPIVRKIPTIYNIDTSDFLRKLKPITKVLENSYLEALDVKSLYTSIPNSEEIKAVKISHENFTKNTIATKVAAAFLALILTLNNFISTQKTFYKPKDVHWELSVHHLTQIYS